MSSISGLKEGKKIRVKDKTTFKWRITGHGYKKLEQTELYNARELG